MVTGHLQPHADQPKVNPLAGSIGPKHRSGNDGWKGERHASQAGRFEKIAPAERACCHAPEDYGATESGVNAAETENALACLSWHLTRPYRLRLNAT